MFFFLSFLIVLFLLLLVLVEDVLCALKDLLLVHGQVEFQEQLSVYGFDFVEGGAVGADNLLVSRVKTSSELAANKRRWVTKHISAKVKKNPPIFCFRAIL